MNQIINTIQKKIKYHFTTSLEKKDLDKLEMLYLKSVDKISEINIICELNIDSRITNKLELDGYLNKFPFFEQLLESEIKISNLNARKKTSIAILNDYLTSCYEEKIVYQTNEFGSVIKRFNFAKTAKKDAMITIKSNLQKLLKSIEQFKILKEENLKTLKDSDIGYNKSFKDNFGSGRNGKSEHKYYALFYSLIDKFYPDDKVLCKLDNRGEFYSEIATKHKFGKDNFSNEFPAIHSDKKFDFLKINTKYIPLLLEDKRLKKYNKIQDFIHTTDKQV